MSIIAQHAGPQLALLSLAGDDWDRADHFCSQALMHFLRDWQSLHPLARHGRVALLQSLQMLREIQEVLEFVRVERNFATMAPLRALLSDWAQRWPLDTSDNIVQWDMLCYGRALLLGRLQARFQVHLSRPRVSGGALVSADDAVSREAVAVTVAEARMGVWRRGVRAAMRQRNWTAAGLFHSFLRVAETQTQGVCVCLSCCSRV